VRGILHCLPLQLPLAIATNLAAAQQLSFPQRRIMSRHHIGTVSTAHRLRKIMVAYEILQSVFLNILNMQNL